MACIQVTLIICSIFISDESKGGDIKVQDFITAAEKGEEKKVDKDIDFSYVCYQKEFVVSCH